MAPRKKASRGVIFLRFSSISLSCSKIVYCNIGFITNMSAGNTPAKRAVGPSILQRFNKVVKLDDFRVGLLDVVVDVGRSEGEE